MTLSGSVGRGGLNVAGDVRLVQRLLNDVRGRARQPLLVVDGICGPKTIAAIELYQRAGGGIVDGRVDPGGPAIKRLLMDHVEGIKAGLLPSAMLPKGAQVQGLTSAALASAFEQYLKLLKK